MSKIFRYTKKHTLAFLLIIVLLFTQAQAELSLPGLMSDIISFGIQNNGITSVIPDAISEEKFDKVLLFLDDQQSSDATATFNLINPNMATAEQIKKFPALANKSLYIKDKSITPSKNLEDGFLFSMAIITSIDNNIILVDNLIQLPAGMTFYEAFNVMPQPQRLNAISELKSSTDQIGEQMLLGVAFKFISEEYTDLGVNMEKLQSDYIISVGIKMLGITLLSVAAAFLVGFFASRVAARIASQIRNDVFSKVANLNAAEYSDFSTASLITRTTNDVQQIQQFIVMFMRIVIYAPIMAVGAVLKVLQSNQQMTWIIAITATVVVLLMLASFSLIVPRFTIIQKLVDKLNLVTRESLSGIMVIRGFDTQDYQAKKFDEVNREVVKNQLFVGNAFAVVRPFLEFLLNATILVIIWFSAKQIDLGQMRIGDMTAFIQYTMQIMMSFIMISLMAIMIPRAAVAIKRIFEVLDKEITIINPVDPIKLETANKAEIFFDDVFFRYPNAEADVISNLSFIAKPGTVTAFIGSTGSGKSTLVNLIPRFYDVTGGAIKINGTDIKDVDIKDLRDQIAFVPQVANLFSGSIASNLQMGKDNASEQQMRSALDIAQASEFVYQRQDAINADVSQGGTNLSGGQKQRLSIARALMKDSNILIFDDTFSALDFKTDSLIREQLANHTKERQATVLIVAQRVSSIMDSDQIIVLDKGLACGAGTHQQLMQSCPVYQEIASSQLSEEELANVKK